MPQNEIHNDDIAREHANFDGPRVQGVICSRLEAIVTVKLARAQKTIRDTMWVRTETQ